MKALTEYIISLKNLVRAEVDSVRHDFFRTAVALVIVTLVGLFCLAAIGLIFLALFLYLAGFMAPAPAVLITGIVALVFAVLLVEIAVWLAR